MGVRASCVLLSLLAVGFDLSAEVVKLEKTSRNGQDFYQLKNEYLTVEVEPAAGGRISRIAGTDGKNLTTAVPPEASCTGSGLLLDRVIRQDSQYTQYRDYERSSYQVTLERRLPNAVELELKRQAEPLSVTKRITLEAGRGSVTVSYTLTNSGKESFSGQFWSAGVILPAGSSALRFYFPYGRLTQGFTDSGGVPQTLELDNRIGEGSKYVNVIINDPARSWVAALNQDNEGLALLVDYPRFGRFYSYQTTKGAGQEEPKQFPTIEWMTQSFALQPLAKGIADAPNRPELADPLESYKYTISCEIMPLKGLQSVAGMESGIAGEIKAEGSDLTIRLLSGRARELTIVAEAIGAAGAKKELTRQEVKLQPLAALEVKTGASPDKEPVVYHVMLKDKDGAIVAEFEKPVGCEGNQYVLNPKQGKDSKFKVLDDAPFFTECGDGRIEWGKNLKRKLRVLVISGMDQHREIAEFLSRMNFDYDLAECFAQSSFNLPAEPFYSWRPPEPQPYLEKMLQKKHDVILVAGGVLWDIIPHGSALKIMEQVRDGAGLVYIFPRGGINALKAPATPDKDASCVTDAVPASLLVGPKSAPLVELYNLDKGRIALLNYTTLNYYCRALTPQIRNHQEHTFNYWEYYFSLVARAVRHAAGDCPKDRVTGAELAGGKLQVKVDSQGAKDAELSVEILNRLNDKVDAFDWGVSLKAGSNSLERGIDLSKLTLNGNYIFNIFLKSGGGVDDWFTTTANRQAPCLIQSLHLAKPSILGNGLVRGRVEISGKTENALCLGITIRDAYGRMLSEQLMPCLPGQLEFEMPLAKSPIGPLCELEAKLTHGAAEIDRQTAVFTVTPERKPDLNFLLWTQNPLWAMRRNYHTFKHLGFDYVTGVHITTSTKEEQNDIQISAMRAGLRYLPMSMFRIGLDAISNDSTVRNPCLRDPKFLGQMSDAIAKYVDWTKDLLPPAYFVADENSLGRYDDPHDYCHSKFCLAAFREHLRQKHNSLDALNQAWNSDFSNWEDVKPSTMAEAKARDNFVSWIEHRLFMFDAVPDALKVQNETLKARDPNGRLAISGQTQTTLNGGLYWHKILPRLEMAIGYIGNNDGLLDVLRSFRKPGSLMASWNGYAYPIPETEQRIWRHVLNGIDTPAFWWSPILLRHGDERPTVTGLAMRELFQKIRSSGADKMFLDSAWEKSPFTVVFSLPSLVASAATGTKTFIGSKTYIQNFGCWTSVIRDAGFQPPLIIDATQLPSVNLAENPALVLPLALSLSDEHIRALEKYVSDGGILVADALPGVFLENGSLRQNSPLARLFGVNYKPITAHVTGGNIAFNGVQLPIQPVDSGLSLSNGKALAESRMETKETVFGTIRLLSASGGNPAPAFVVGRSGKGSTAYLNTTFADYGKIRCGQGCRSLVRAMTEVFKLMGVKSEINAELPPGSELVRCRDGSSLYMGLTRLGGESKNGDAAVISLPGRLHVYEILGRHYLGFTDKIETELKPLETKTLALLPQKIDQLTSAASFKNDDFVFEMKLEPRDATGIVRVEVVDPEGKTINCHTGNHKIKGSLLLTIQPGLHPLRGNWRLRAVEVVSGKTTESAVEVK